MHKTVLTHDLERIAVFRALNLGDLLCSTPALRALRKQFPRARITLIGLPYMADFAARYTNYIDEFVSFPGAPGLPEQPYRFDALIDFLHRERDAHYDLVLQMHGKGSIANPLLALLGARRLAGFYEAGEYCPDPETFLPYPDSIPEVDRHLKLMEFLGVASQGRELELPIRADEYENAQRIRHRKGLVDAPYVCVHPGARDQRRWWEPEKFALVADELHVRGYRVVFTGTAEELPIVEGIRGMMRCPSLSLVGKTGLGELAALIAHAALLVSNDTGASHVAAAVATPSVVIFLASDPVRWAPADRARHRVVLPEEAGDIEVVLSHAEEALRNPRRVIAV